MNSAFNVDSDAGRYARAIAFTLSILQGAHMTRTSFRSIRVAAVVFTLAAVPALAHAQSAAPASLTGTWTMSLIGDHVIPVALVLEQDGSSLKGTFILMGKDFPVTGTIAGDKLTLTGKGPAFGRGGGDHNAAVAAGGGSNAQVIAGPAQPGTNAVLADMTITGTADGNGGFAGDVALKTDTGTGMIKWTAERLKERKVPASQVASTDGVSLTGDWKMHIVEAQLDVELELRQAGNKVTGSAMSEHLGKMTLAGTLASGTLSFTTVGSTGGQEVRIEYTGKHKADGTFAGDLTSQMGAMTWTAARVKK
jgi:hypothetical protein